MNDDLISREALRRRMYHEAFEVDNGMQRWDSGLWIRYKVFENAIEEAPAVEPERKTGKWVLNKYGNWACPFCEFDPYHDNMKGMNFCPNCGARLEGTP